MIWAYGNTQNCRWMGSAYKAADLRKPWMHYNDFCVRAYCEAAFSITGRNIRREVDKSFVGKKHNAIDDCKHQILYLTKCRDVFRGLQGSAITPVPAGPISESSVKRPRTVLDDNRSRMGLDWQQTSGEPSRPASTVDKILTNTCPSPELRHSPSRRRVTYELLVRISSQRLFIVIHWVQETMGICHRAC